MLLNIILFISFSVIYFFLDAAHDSNLQKWRNSRSQEDVKKYSGNWHTIDAIIKGMVGAFISYYIFGFTLIAGQFLALFLVIRWIWFDAALNLFNGLPIGYVGQTAFLDRIFKVENTQYVFKFILLTIVIISIATIN